MYPLIVGVGVGVVVGVGVLVGVGVGVLVIVGVGVGVLVGFGVLLNLLGVGVGPVLLLTTIFFWVTFVAPLVFGLINVLGYA